MAGLRAYHSAETSETRHGNVSVSPLPLPAATPQTSPATPQFLTLNPAESAHLVRSLRARPGEAIEAFNGTGRVWRGTVHEANPRGLVMEVAAVEDRLPTRPRLALAQALPKGGLMSDIIRAAVELDAAEIHPLYTDHCEVRLDPARAAARVEHWRAAAVEACKQSGNPFLPHIAAPAPLKTWLAGEFPKTLAFIGSLEPGAPPLELTARTTGNAGVADANANDAAAVAAPERLLVLIGPEGDFSPAEYALIRARGFRAVRFGPNVLRVPTAAHYALAALDQLRQRLFANANSSTA